MRLSSMNLEQTYIPGFSYCTYCGLETESETCSPAHSQKLTAIRNAIANQKESDKARGFGSAWTDKTIRQYNELMDILDR